MVGMVLGLLVVGSSVARAQEEEKEDKPRRSRDVITADEIAERGDLQTAWDAVKRLRPAFLRVRGSRSGTSGMDVLRIYIDTLKSISADAVLEIRRLSASDATFRYGRDHPQGAIVVTTRRTMPLLR
jgi:hypothetical protein